MSAAATNIKRVCASIVGGTRTCVVAVRPSSATNVAPRYKSFRQPDQQPQKPR